MCQKGRSCVIFVGDVHVHMLESRLEGLWMLDVEGRHCWVWVSGGEEDELWQPDQGHLFIYRPR